MGVSAKVIAHSKSSVNGKEIITFELEYPRIIHSEFVTHNALSKNSSSSRAIPVSKMVEQVETDCAFPVRFGVANKGMQDAGEHNRNVYSPVTGEGYPPKVAWVLAATSAAQWSKAFHDAGYAKQICNRLIEPFQMMKVVMTATELNNFIWLRDHPAADPTIEALAKAIKKAKEESEPVTLLPGMWHVPYFGEGYWCEEYEDGPLEDALAISASCCAQVSFRSLDDSIDKAYSIGEKLNLKGGSDEPVHASPTEHQATPMQSVNISNLEDISHEWEDGITHMDRDGTFCSGNLKGWIQHRQLIPNNVKRG